MTPHNVPSSSEEDENGSAEVFARSLMGKLNREDIVAMVQTQRDMLSRYEKTNEMLINFNILSASRFDVTTQEFRKHTQLLFEMKKDLDVIFRRIRILKQRLGMVHPEAFAACSDVYNLMEDGEEEEGKMSTAKSEGFASEPVPASSEPVKSSSISVIADEQFHRCNCR
ncbi:hypothetical protein CHS0354_028964 [Potamilus streckersoni]|uniref:KxDL domain-containing protein n=1 Tax=Potamilus streckersoni TaxID=2493646 RepID=A0AAE0SAY1_9BIVA|nr:hypothetical protein CHS0354_028964 [Potamilus streckersoni]